MTIFLSSPFTKGSHQSSMTFLPLHYSILFRVFLSVCQCSKSFLFFFFKDILVYYTLTKTVSSIRVFLLWLSHYKSSAFLISSIIHMSSVSYLLLVLMAITKFKKKNTNLGAEVWVFSQNFCTCLLPQHPRQTITESPHVSGVFIKSLVTRGTRWRSWLRHKPEGRRFDSQW